MPQPRANSLYRYIREWKWFKRAIADSAFVPRFCEEDFCWMEQDRPRCVFLPMVCFCDIPIASSRDHRRAYGDFVIGLKKDWGRNRALNPVLYVSDKSDLAALLGEAFNRAIARQKPVEAEFGEFWPVLPYLKPDQGFQRNGRFNEFKFFEQEMEWRFVPDEWANLIETRRLDNRTDAEKLAQNATVSAIRLRFDDDDIEVAIVKTSKQRSTLHALRPSLRGKVKLWREINRRRRK